MGKTLLFCLLIFTTAALSAKTEKKDSKDSEAKIYKSEEIVVTVSKIKRKLAKSPVKIEVITAKQIEKKGASNIIEVLESTLGVRIDNQCSICNTTAVKLSGVPGRYTLLLIDGFPIHSSLGQTYGWLNIAAADIEQIEIMKGSQSVLYGTDAIGGIVNVVTKKPHRKPHMTVSAEVGNYGYNQVTGSASYREGDLGISLVTTHSMHDSIDRDNDGLSEYTGYVRKTFGGNITYKFSKSIKNFTRFAIAQEQRQGGGMGDFMPVLNDVRRDFSESILTNRIELGNRTTFKLNNKHKVNLLFSYNYHKQDSDYEGEVYVGKQHLYTGEVHGIHKFNKNVTLIEGVSFKQEHLNENLAISEYDYTTFGIFAQGDFDITKSLNTTAGVRYDHHNEFGSVFTPSLAIRFSPSKMVTLRINGGTGFRAPTTFYEYAHGVRPEGYTLVNNADEAEKSYNGNFDLTLSLPKFQFVIGSAFTRIEDAITVDVASEADGAIKEGDVIIHNVNENLDIFSIEASLTYKPINDIIATVGYGYYNYTDDAGALVSAPPVHQITWDLNYQIAALNKVNININGSLFSPMDLTKVYGEAYNASSETDTVEEWLDPSNADTTSLKLDKSPWYFTLNAKIIIPVYKDMAKLHFGINNILDYHQSDEESPLMFPREADGSAGDADVVYVWGPMKGRFFYSGLTIKL